MTIPTRTAKLMNAIPGAAKAWPQWYTAGKFDPPTDGRGDGVVFNGDLTHPDNYAHVWRIAEHLALGTDVQVVKWGYLNSYRTRFYRARIGSHYADDYSPQTALLAACEAAVKGVNQ